MIPAASAPGCSVESSHQHPAGSDPRCPRWSSLGRSTGLSPGRPVHVQHRAPSLLLPSAILHAGAQGLATSHRPEACGRRPRETSRQDASCLQGGSQLQRRRARQWLLPLQPLLLHLLLQQCCLHRAGCYRLRKPLAILVASEMPELRSRAAQCSRWTGSLHSLQDLLQALEFSPSAPQNLPPKPARRPRPHSRERLPWDIAEGKRLKQREEAETASAACCCRRRLLPGNRRGSRAPQDLQRSRGLLPLIHFPH